jgi:hypothetical protein
MKRFIVLISGTALAVLSAIIVYLAWWAVWYRLPAAACEIIDMRATQLETPCYITFCAGLASNPHGFPGHAYVVWRRERTADLLNAQATGYVPLNPEDQIRSLYTSVPGLVVPKASHNNMRSLETLTVIVDPKTYERTLHLASQWESQGFKAGSRDCVSFVDFIASDIGLATFRPDFEYPRDHIRRLQLLNRTQSPRKATAFRLVP